jgi:nitrite transporter
MPIPIPEAVEESVDLARSKADQLRREPLRYLLSAVMAGAYVGVAVVLLASVAGPLFVATSPAVKLVSGVVFGIALTLVVFAGSSLFTGEVMWMLQGLVNRGCRLTDLLGIWIASLVGNLAGSVGFAWLVHQGGTLAIGPRPGRPGPSDLLIASLVAGMIHATGSQLFFRSVLCYMLVCLALWMAARTRSDAAKLVVLWWCLFAFVAAGFEHSIANMTIFSLAVLDHAATWYDLWRNLLFTVPGNIVGGGLLVGLAYAYLAGRAAQPAPALLTAPLPRAALAPTEMVSN